MRYILSIDQSTSATKGFLWDEAGRKLADASFGHRQIVNSLGWVEHDAEEIYRNVLLVSRKVLQKARVRPELVETLGLSNQRETVVCWDAKTEKPMVNAIVWQCARAAELVASLEKTGVAEMVRQRTGLPLSPYFSAAKLCWVIRNIPEAQEALGAGRLRVGTMDAWLCNKLTGMHRTDYSNASRTQLLNLDTLQWDTELLELFGIRPECMPEICMSDSCFGYTDMEGLFPRKIPVHGMLGDSHAALLANRCLTPGMAKVTYGTGSSIMTNAGDTRPTQYAGLSVSLAWGLKGRIQYVLEGNINYTGSVIKWLCEDVGILDSPKQAGEIAHAVESTNGVYLVPAFSGLGAPWFCNDVRGAFLGMNRTTGRAHMIRAAEECIAYQVTDVVEAMYRAMGTPLRQIRVDGGLTNDRFLMQFQTDMLGIPLSISRTAECSAAGAALCAAVAQGISDPEVAFRLAYQELQPQMPTQARDALYHGWKLAIQTLLYRM